MARLTLWWLSVGGASTVAVRSNEMRPTRKPFGNPPTNVLAAALAASMRDGETSVAFMDADVSIVSITTAASLATRLSTTGRASPKMRPTNAIAAATAGTWRRHPGYRGATDARRRTLVK